MASEPTFEDIYEQFRKDPTFIPSEFLLNLTNNFVNKQRYTFLTENQAYIRSLANLLVSGVNFYSAPETIRAHYLYPDSSTGGPVSIFVGGASLNLFEGIDLGSTDIDIDLLPLVNRTVVNTQAQVELLPIYTADHRLTPVYQEYFDWLLERVANLLDGSNLQIPSMTPMIERNIQTNIEVIRASTYDRRAFGIPGEVRAIKVVGKRTYILAQIINDQFFSKVAVWIRVGDDLERIIEFKLLTKVPEVSKYEPAGAEGRANGIWKPTRQKYIENALETLNYRLDALQRDVLDYNETLRKIFLLPEVYLLQREESLRKKLLASKMRIQDIFRRLYALFSGIGADEQSIKLLLGLYSILINKSNTNFFNRVAFAELTQMDLSKFPVFAGFPYFVILNSTYLYPKKIIVDQQYSTSLKAAQVAKEQALEQAMAKGYSLEKVDKLLRDALQLKDQQESQAYKLRQVAVEKAIQSDLAAAIQKEEQVKKEDVGESKGEKGEDEDNSNASTVLSSGSNSNSNSNAGTVLSSGSNSNSNVNETESAKVSRVQGKNGTNTTNTRSTSVSPTNDRSGSPGYLNNSERTLELFREEQARELDELYALVTSLGSKNNKEAEEQITSLFSKQQAMRNQKQAALKKRQEAEREAKKEKRKKQSEKEQAQKALQAQKNAENNALLASLEKQRKEENKAKEQLQQERLIFYYLESPSYYPNNYLFDVYQTFMPAIFFENDVRAPLIGYKFPDYTHTLKRDELFTEAEFHELPSTDQVDTVPANEFVVVDEIYEVRIVAQINEYILTTILFTFEDMDSSVIVKNIQMTTNLLYQIAAEYMHYMVEKFYASPYKDKFYSEIFESILQIKKTIGELEGNLIKLQMDIQATKKKKDIQDLLNKMDLQKKQLYSQILNISVGFLTFLFPMLINCHGNKLPKVPTVEDFNTAYKPLLTLTIGKMGRNKYLMEKYHRAIFDFEQTLFIYHSSCMINSMNISKHKKFKGLEVNPPVLVLTTLPTPYRNPVASYEDQSIKPLNFSFFENLYTTLKEFNFSFFEEYPLFKEYIKLYPGFAEPFLNILKGYSPMKQLKLRQSVEVNLQVSRAIWITIESNYGGEIQAAMLKRFNIFLMKLTQENYVLNAFSQWERILEFIEAKDDSGLIYTDDDLVEIANIMVTRWKHFYAIRFLYPAGQLPPMDKILRGLPYARGLKQVNDRIKKEIAEYFTAKAMSLGPMVSSSTSTASKGKKGGMRRKTRKLYRKH